MAGVDDMDPLELLRSDIKDDDYEQQIASVNRLGAVAIALGPERTRDELLPYLKDGGEIDNDEASAAVAAQLGDFVPYVGGPAYATSLFPILEQLAVEEETVIRQAAVESMLKVFSQTLRDDLIKHAFPLTRRLASGEWFSGRISAACVFHGVYAVLSELDQNELLGWFTRLCNDDVPMVRKAAYEHIGALSRVLNKENIKAHTLSIIKSIAEDHMDTMRTYTINACAEVSEYLDPQENVELLLPFIELLHDDASWKVRQELCKSMEDLCKHFTPQPASDKLLPIFAKLLQDGEVMVRLTACKQLPKVCAVAKHGLLDHIAPHLEAFMTDDNDKVRVAFSQSIVQLCQSFGPELSQKLLIPIIIHLAKDENTEVRCNMISQLRLLSEALRRDILEESILPIVIELSKDAKWRVRMEVVGQSCLLAEQLGKEIFERKVLDLVLAALSDHVFSIRERACEQIAQLIGLWGLEWSSSKLLPTSLSLYDKSTNYLHRTTALIIIKYVCPLVNNKGLVEKFLLPTALKACSDEVANVRFVAAKTLTEMASFVEKTTAESFKPALLPLLKDEDGDVQYFAEQALKAVSDVA